MKNVMKITVFFNMNTQYLLSVTLSMIFGLTALAGQQKLMCSLYLLGAIIINITANCLIMFPEENKYKIEKTYLELAGIITISIVGMFYASTSGQKPDDVVPLLLTAVMQKSTTKS